MKSAAIDADDEIRIWQQHNVLLKRFDVFISGGILSNLTTTYSTATCLLTWSWPSELFCNRYIDDKEQCTIVGK